jgi:hypothetical protein
MHYRLLFLDSEGHITDLLELGCRDDARAIALAGQFSCPSKMELWEGSRLVKRVASGKWPADQRRLS